MSVIDDRRDRTSMQGRPEPMVLLIHQSGSDMSRIHDYLEREAFRVSRAKSFPIAVFMARSCQPDVVVLQTETTDNGLQLMRQILRERAVPIIIVAPPGHADPVKALEHGADDYMVNPAALPELAARARAAARRAWRSADRVRRVGALELDAQSRRVRASNRRLSLTPVEYSILECLTQAPGQVVTHDDLVRATEKLGGHSTASLGSRIQRLRMKLAAAGVHEPFITAVRGIGYRLDTTWSQRGPKRSPASASTEPLLSAAPLHRVRAAR